MGISGRKISRYMLDHLVHSPAYGIEESEKISQCHLPCPHRPQGTIIIRLHSIIIAVAPYILKNRILHPRQEMGDSIQKLLGILPNSEYWGTFLDPIESPAHDIELSRKISERIFIFSYVP